MRILVVADQPSALGEWVNTLQTYGTCETAEGLERVVTHLDQAHKEGQAFGLLVVDCDPTPGRAAEVVSAVRGWESRESLGAVRILLAATAVSPETVAAATSAGADAFLTKPVDASALRAVLGSLGIGAKLSLKRKDAAPGS